MNLYEERLRGLYVTMLAAFDNHKHHTPDGSTCPQQVSCDGWGDLVHHVIEQAFPPEEAERFVVEGPPDLLDWTTGDLWFDTGRETIVQALVWDAHHQRLFPGAERRPQDPDFTFSGACPACGLDPRSQSPCEECGDMTFEPVRP